MILGIAVSLFWKLGLELSNAVYEVFLEMAAGFIVYLIAYLYLYNKRKYDCTIEIKDSQNLKTA